MSVRRAEKIVNEFGEGNAELFPEALAEAVVILRATEKVAKEFAESGAAASELNHARGDGAAEKSAAENAADEARGDFEITDEFGAKARRIIFGLCGDERLREEVAGTQGVEKAFASDGVDASGGVSSERPVAAGDFTVAQSAEFRRRENVAVELRAGDGDFFFANESVEQIAQALRGVLRHFRADADGEMVGARKRPEIAGHAIEKFDFDHFFFGGDEVAEGDFEIARAKRSCAGEELVARACGEDDEIGGVFSARGGERNLRAGSVHTGDASVMHFASGGFGAAEEKAVQNGAGINHQRARHLKAGAMPARGDEFGVMNLFFGGRAVEEEGIFFDGFVGEAAAAGFFPGQMLVEKRDVESGDAQFLGAKSAGRTAADNGNVFHSRVLPTDEKSAQARTVEYSTKCSAAGLRGVALGGEVNK